MEATVQVHCALFTSDLIYLTLCYVRCSTSSLLVINHVAMSLYSIITFFIVGKRKTCYTLLSREKKTDSCQ